MPDCGPNDRTPLRESRQKESPAVGGLLWTKTKKERKIKEYIPRFAEVGEQRAISSFSWTASFSLRLSFSSWMRAGEDGLYF